jgi:hypothetical protein
MSKEGVDAFGGLDDQVDKEKDALLPLIIDGLEVDREVIYVYVCIYIFIYVYIHVYICIYTYTCME